MFFVVMMIFIALFLGALLAFYQGFTPGIGPLADGTFGQRRFAPKWLGLGGLLAGLTVLMGFAVVWPVMIRERIAEAENITRKTFREKLGREPRSLHFDATNRDTSGNGWKYVGTAQLGEDIWDVTVTRSNDSAARKTKLQCDAVPRK